MGCGEDKISSEENGFVTRAECELWGRRPLPCAQVEVVFYKTMREGQFSREKIVKLSKALGLQLSPELISAFTHHNDLMDITKLFRLMLLLSVGTKLEKATALWDLQDESGSEVMSRAQLESFMEALAASALDHIAAVTGKDPLIGKNRLETWLGVLRTKRGKLAKDMANLYLNGAETVSKDRFLDVIRVNAQADVTNPTVIRTRLEEIKAVPPKFAAVFSAKPLT
jgi:hypothetical protein